MFSHVGYKPFPNSTFPTFEENISKKVSVKLFARMKTFGIIILMFLDNVMMNFKSPNKFRKLNFVLDLWAKKWPCAFC